MRRTAVHAQIVALVAVIALLPAASRCAGAADCAPTDPHAGKPAASLSVVDGLDLACCPAKLFAQEGAWTFLLAGGDALRVADARLVVADRTLTPVKLLHTTPASLLIDFVFDTLPAGAPGELRLIGGDQRELARVPIAIEPASDVPPETRQDDLVRVQMRQGVILYPLHGFPGDGVAQRTIEDLGGDPTFLARLHQLDLQGLKKIQSRYAEDDSIHWDPRYLRNEVYPGATLRQYIFYIAPERSEAAYREILLAFDEVENAFVNRDYRKAPKK